MGVQLVPGHSCHPLSPPPASGWGVPGSEPAPPPEDTSCLPTSGPAPHLVHSVASLVLSSHWGVPPPHSQVEMFKPHPSSHPLDPTRALCPANGAHMLRDAGWRQARPAKNVAGGLPGGGVALKRAASVSPTPADAEGVPPGVGGSTVATRCWEVALGHRRRRQDCGAKAAHCVVPLGSPGRTAPNLVGFLWPE